MSDSPYSRFAEKMMQKDSKYIPEILKMLINDQQAELLMSLPGTSDQMAEDGKTLCGYLQSSSSAGRSASFLLPAKTRRQGRVQTAVALFSKIRTITIRTYVRFGITRLRPSQRGLSVSNNWPASGPIPIVLHSRQLEFSG